MPASERDPRLDRLFALTDGVYAIALTLLAIELALPAASERLHGEELLRSILDTWPKVLGFLTSFTLIAIFWHGNHRAFHYLRRYDGPLDWLSLLQLLCVAFIPFPTAIVGEHVSDPVAQVFYFGAILVTGLATMALWWYASSGHRLVDPELHPGVIRRFHMTLLVGPVAGSIALIALIGVGIGRLINPLLLGYLFLVGFILLGVLEGWEPRLQERRVRGAPEDGASAQERPEGSDPARTDG
jgi:TMEM175 potassium channel family protein